MFNYCNDYRYVRVSVAVVVISAIWILTVTTASAFVLRINTACRIRHLTTQLAELGSTWNPSDPVGSSNRALHSIQTALTFSRRITTWIVRPTMVTLMLLASSDR